MIKAIFLFIFLIHGLIHLMGFVKAFRLAEMSQLTLPISKQYGIVWLISALLFLVAIAVFVLKKDWWWMIAVFAIIISQLLIILYWKNARFGTIANLIILVAIVTNAGNWSFNRMVKGEVSEFVQQEISINNKVSNGMIAGLPPLIQMWLKRSNIVGKNIIQTVYLKQKGQMRSKQESKWLP